MYVCMYVFPDILDGEVYFYRNIPADVQQYFPKYIDSSVTYKSTTAHKHTLTKHTHTN